tara:strand:+ start:1117 stop:1554 length:438 start_codon:yes stop_codon:yes gene_type:complete
MRNAKLLKYLENKNCGLTLHDGKIAVSKLAVLTKDMQTVIDLHRETIIEDLKEQTKTQENLFNQIMYCKNWSGLELILQSAEKLFHLGAIGEQHLAEICSRVCTRAKIIPNDGKNSKVETALKIELVTKEIDGEIVKFPKSWDNL